MMNKIKSRALTAYKSILIPLIIFLIGSETSLVFGQAGTVTAPSATASSFATYVSIPPATCSGIPNISYPLLSLPTKSKDVTFNFSLQYHPNNISNQHQASDVGLGWSLFGGGIITRYIDRSPDEFSGYNENAPFQDDDEYFYNFFGYSGRFKFKRQQNGTYKVIHHSQNALQIDFVSTAISGIPLGINPTTITMKDGNGISYVFSTMSYTRYLNGFARGALHLTKIQDQNGTEIASLEYKKIPFSSSNGNTGDNIYTSTLEKATAHGLGTVEFGVGSNPGLDFTRSDRAQINSVKLKNYRGETIRQCALEYLFRAHQPRWPRFPSTESVRFLKKLDFSGSDNIAVEKYAFDYIHRSHDGTGGDYFDNYGFSKQDYPNTAESGRNGVLEKVTLPTGGQIIYDFMSNKIENHYGHNDVYFSGPGHDQFFSEETDFASQNQRTDLVGSQSGFNTPDYSGTYFLGGLRIQRIRYLDAAGQLIPSKTVTYDYRDLDNPLRDSGQIFIEKLIGKHGEQPDYLLYEAKVYYKHIKVAVGTGNGYTRYHYFTPYDTMKNDWIVRSPYGRPERFEWRSFLLLQDGIPKHVETYSENNLLLQRDRYFYATSYLPASSGSTFYLMWSNGYYFGAYNNEIYHTYKVSEKYSYNPDSKLVEKSFKRYNPNNFQLDSEATFGNKNVQNSQLGAVTRDLQTKVKYFYPKDIPTENMAAELIAKNMVLYPMRTETYTEGNVLLGTEKNIYDNFGNGWLGIRSAETSKGSDDPEARIKILKTDITTGNPEEVENEDGTRTSYIWGYNGTLLLAKIENMSYQNIPLSLLQQVKQLSSSATPNPNLEQQLLSYLNTIRTSSQLTQSLMTSYTHKPLVGVSTITDPRDNTIYYSYDAFGRLSSVRDSKGNLVSENKYRLKTQN